MTISRVTCSPLVFAPRFKLVGRGGNSHFEFKNLSANAVPINVIIENGSGWHNVVLGRPDTVDDSRVSSI